MYPWPTDGWVPIDWLTEAVTPMYLSTLPRADGWGHALIFWSDGASYVIVSPGKDAEPERDWAAGDSPRGPSMSFAADIVFANGEFVQWPEGRQE